MSRSLTQFSSCIPWNVLSPNHTGLTTMLRPCCDLRILKSWDDRRLIARLVSEVVGDRGWSWVIVGDRASNISRSKLFKNFCTGISNCRDVILVELLRPPYWLNLAFLSRSIKFGATIHMTLLTNIGYGYTLAAPCG